MKALVDRLRSAQRELDAAVGQVASIAEVARLDASQLSSMTRNVLLAQARAVRATRAHLEKTYESDEEKSRVGQQLWEQRFEAEEAELRIAFALLLSEEADQSEAAE